MSSCIWSDNSDADEPEAVRASVRRHLGARHHGLDSPVDDSDADPDYKRSRSPSSSSVESVTVCRSPPPTAGPSRPSSTSTDQSTTKPPPPDVSNHAGAASKKAKVRTF